MVLLLWKTITNRSNLWEKLFLQLSTVLNLQYRTCVMAKSLLKFIVKIVMTLLTVVKFLMDKNVERKFCQFFCLSNIACSRNKTYFRKKIEKRCLSIKEAFYPYFSVLSPFQRFILVSAFYPHFSVLSPFQRFILISAFYPHFSFSFRHSVSAFYPNPNYRLRFNHSRTRIKFEYTIIDNILKI